MPVWLVTVLALGGSALIACVVNFCFGLSVEGTKKKRERKRQDEMDSIRNVIREELKPIKEEVDSLKNAEKLNLRHNIIYFIKDKQAQGWADADDRSHLKDLFDAYVSLKGNSFVEGRVKEFYLLPRDEKEYLIKRKEEEKKLQ